MKGLFRYFFLKYFKVQNVLVFLAMLIALNIYFISLFRNENPKNVINIVTVFSVFSAFIISAYLIFPILGKDIKNKSTDFIFISPIKRYQYIVVAFFLTVLFGMFIFILVFAGNSIFYYWKTGNSIPGFGKFMLSTLLVLIYFSSLLLFFTSFLNEGVAFLVFYLYINLCITLSSYFLFKLDVPGIPPSKFYMLSILYKILSPFLISGKMFLHLMGVEAYALSTASVSLFIFVSVIFLILSIKRFNLKEFKN
ncbi:MAG: hypothetical protein PHV06_06620 [bacterium]|nr:hypothetical protein [bacterium]